MYIIEVSKEGMPLRMLVNDILTPFDKGVEVPRNDVDGMRGEGLYSNYTTIGVSENGKRKKFI